MLADIDVNTTVYVQPIFRDLMDFMSAGAWRRDDVGRLATAKQLAVAPGRNSGLRGLACVLVTHAFRQGKARKSELHERRDNRVGTVLDAASTKHGADFLLQLTDGHGLAFQLHDQLAQGLRGCAKSELTQQLI